LAGTVSEEPRTDAEARAASVRTLQVAETDRLSADETAVVVDVLRASTTICVALVCGVDRVIPVETVEAAREVGEELEDAVLVGERDRGQLEGFVDNSPASVAELDLDGRPVVLTTTNGTQALAASEAAGRVLVGCMANADALREAVAGEDVALVAAGWRGEPAEDDDACCAYLAELLRGEDPDREAAIEALEASTSATKLREHGKGDDADLCLSVDRYQLVPERDGEALVAAG
jgi:2-phosphosulfolactate phosphatase